MRQLLVHVQWRHVDVDHPKVHAGICQLFVELVMAVGALFGVVSALDWVLRLALLTGAALPATLVWLVVACALKHGLAAKEKQVSSCTIHPEP